MKRTFLITTFLMMALSSQVSAKQGSIDQAFLASLIKDVKQSADLPSGTAIAIVEGDRITYQGQFGYADIQAKRKVEADSLFYIASVTKPFTALNFLLDANQNKISPSTSLEDMFPQFALSERRAVTIKDLLIHTASVNNLPLVLATAYSGVHTPDSLRDVVVELSTASSEQMGEFKYTNVGYNLYSLYSDRLFNESWQNKLRRQIFVPAKMLSTTARASQIEHPNKVVKPYSLTHSSPSDALYLRKSDATMHAAGGMFATASDLGRFVVAQLNQGKIDGQQIFPAAVIAQSQTQQATTDRSYLDFKRNGYAWGWYTGDYKGERMLHHFGGFAGAHAHISFLPEQKIGLVVLNNEDFLSSRLTNIVADYVYGALLGQADIKEKAQKRVSELKTKLAGLAQHREKQMAKIQSRKWLLSQHEQHYVGKYRHASLGTIEIDLNEEGRFDVRWGALRSHSTGMDKLDQIRVTLDPTSGSVVTFDVSDKVDAIVYAGIRFTKENS